MTKYAICEKVVHFRNNVSHSHRKSNHTWKANAKSVKVKAESGVRKMYIRTSCLRSNLAEGT